MAYTVFGRCPACAGRLDVTELHCPQCDTLIRGHYALHRLMELAPEQLAFVETFIRCEGRINRVEEELGISYPTVRSRLAEVITALGYKLREEPPGLSSDERQAVLDALAAGSITAQEAVERLRTR